MKILPYSGKDEFPTCYNTQPQFFWNPKKEALKEMKEMIFYLGERYRLTLLKYTRDCINATMKLSNSTKKETPDLHRYRMSILKQCNKYITNKLSKNNTYSYMYDSPSYKHIGMSIVSTEVYNVCRYLCGEITYKTCMRNIRFA